MKPQQRDARGRPLTAAGKRNQEIQKVYRRIKRYINKKNTKKTWAGQESEIKNINNDIVRLGITRKARVKPGKTILNPSVKKKIARIESQIKKVDKSKKISGTGADKAKAKLNKDRAKIKKEVLSTHAGFGTERPPEMRKSGGRIGKKHGGKIKYYNKGGGLSKVAQKQKPRGVGVARHGYGKAMPWLENL
jgi:hypothetical protein